MDARVPALSDAKTPADRVDATVDAAVSSGAPRVTLTTGVVEGSVAGTTRVFMGVPYAQAERFKAPQPAAPWPGTRNATQAGAICPQPPPATHRFPGVSELPQSEDCLNLNVYAPQDAKQAPVMVFIHGGSQLTGAGSDYDGRYLSEAGNVVVVTINYRLGVLGWLAHPALDGDVPSGNYGLRDQQQALRWVQENIAAFGGDAKNVTLFGQSAGSHDTCLLMFAEGSEGLAHRFIMQSSACMNSAVGPQKRAGVEAVAGDLVASFCKEADVATCLRSVPMDMIASWKNPRPSMQEMLAPYVDGKLIPAHPLALVRAGKFVHAPVIIGSNEHEINFLQSDFWGGKWPLVNNGIEMAIGVAAMYPDDFAAMLAQYGYPASDAAANEQMVRMMNDSWFHCTSRAVARELSAQGVSVWLYRFALGAALHTEELAYIFGWPQNPIAAIYPSVPDVSSPQMVTAMQSYWLNLARTGDPNGSSVPAWPKYAPNTLLRLQDPITVDAKMDPASCDFWDKQLEARLN